MRYSELLTALALLCPVAVQASVADEISRLEQAKARHGTPLLDFGLPGT